MNARIQESRELPTQIASGESVVILAKVGSVAHRAASTSATLWMPSLEATAVINVGRVRAHVVVKMH